MKLPLTLLALILLTGCASNPSEGMMCLRGHDEWRGGNVTMFVCDEYAPATIPAPAFGQNGN
jgi:hypothetical protein